MQISSNINTIGYTQDSSKVKTLYTEKLTKEEVDDLKIQIEQNTHAFTFKSTNIQSNILGSEEQFAKDYQDFQNFLKDIGYTGGPIAELSQDEATALVSEDGFFGVEQTSQRIANFVISGADGDEELLRAGREGMIQGFEEAEKMWGGELPEISQETINKAIEMIDKAMYDLGFSILDKEA